jgi:hypothetical protein
MAVTLPLANQRWAKFRVLTRPSWGGTSASGGGWKIQVMQNPGPEASGLILESYSRSLLPSLGTARIIYRFGKIGSKIVAAGPDQAAAMQQGEQWDPTSELEGIPDLTNQEIRIQAGYPDEDGNVGAGDWRTVWWGTCEYQTDEGWGGAAIPSGERTYHCIDAFHRTKRWFLNRHGFVDTVSGGVTGKCMGNPGYNYSAETSRIIGNRGPEASTWVPAEASLYALCHTMAGAGEEWTDEQVLANCMAASRPSGQPLWVPSYADGAAGAPELMAAVSSWPVQDTESVFDLVTRICDRSRGRGAAYPDFTESSPTGPLTCKLMIYSQLAADLNYTNPVDGSDVSIDGAIADNTEVEVDVIGDHRFVDGSLSVTDPEQYRVDYLETVGEPIEVLVTLGYVDSTLEIGWKATQETTFRGLDPYNRTEAKWSDVLQFHRLPRNFLCTVGDGNGGSTSRCDFRCSDAGQITTPSGTSDTSPASIVVIDDTPIFLGYNYESTPVRYDSSTDAQYGGDPARMPWRYFIRTEAEKFLELKETGEGFSVLKHPDGFHLSATRDKDGYRYFNAGTAGNLNSAYHYNKLVVTCAIRLPHRVRMANGNPNGARQKRIEYQGLHLWMAHPGAIWDVDSSSRTSSADGSPPRRGASASATPAGVLRDDRAELARVHAISRVWWGVLPDTESFASMHRGASWSLKCCGDIPSSEDYDGGGLVYPTCGKVLRYLYANGQRLECNSPVSSYIYDNVSGISSWQSDWAELDTSRLLNARR